MIDLLVVGAGPAGLATAIAAAEAGMTVQVLEQRPGPVDKACAEGLMPGAVRVLRSLGIELSGMAFHGIRYLSPKQQVEARFSDGPGRGVRRTDLSAALLDRCSGLGVTVSRATVGRVDQDSSSVTAGGCTGRYLVAADGLHSPVRRQLGLDRPVAGPARIGLRRHYRMEPWTDLVEVHWARDAEAYVTPIGPDLVGLAVLSRRRATIQEHLRSFPELAARLPAEAATPTRGASPLRQRSAARSVGRVFLVGDAAGYVDALTGEGIAIAAATGVALAGSLADDRPQDYEGQWQQITRRYRRLTSSLLWVTGRPVLRKALVPAAAAAPMIFRRAVDSLAR